MMVAVECAKAATTYAAWAIDERATTRRSPRYRQGHRRRCLPPGDRQAVQLHGGIGFTWEHDLHIFYKRAMSGEVAFGDATWSRELVAQQLGL